MPADGTSPADFNRLRTLFERAWDQPTLNARLAALSGFYRFLRETAATELKLPIQVPNPAHAQFIGRESPDPVDPTLPLGLTKARKLMSLPTGGDVFEARDRAILKVFLYAGIRIGTACRLTVADFVDDPDDPKILIEEKGRGKASTAAQLGPQNGLVSTEAIRSFTVMHGCSRQAAGPPESTSRPLVALPWYRGGGRTISVRQYPQTTSASHVAAWIGWSRGSPSRPGQPVWEPVAQLVPDRYTAPGGGTSTRRTVRACSAPGTAGDTASGQG